MIQTSHAVEKKITIKANDDFQSQVKKGLSVQAKSGVSQSLLNNQKRDQIKAIQLVNWDMYLKILNDFYINKAQDSRTIQTDNLAAYANWVFSKNIAKSTLGKNNLFLSRYGFTTLDTILEKTQKSYVLSPNANTMQLLVSTGVFNIKTM